MDYKILLCLMLLVLESCNGTGHSSPEAVKPLVPIIGHRFSITGDFNGDGIIDTLTERYTHQGQETNKIYEGIEYDSLVALIALKEKQCYLEASENIDSLFISGNAQLFGLVYLNNEGDLDGDGADEIGYVVHWADWSSFNTYHIASYKKKQWLEIYSFPIHEIVMLPDYDQLDQAQDLVKSIGNYRMLIVKWNTETGDTVSEIVEIK